MDPSGHEACPAKETAINKLKEEGLSDAEAEAAYQKMRDSGMTAEEIAKVKRNGNRKSGEYHTFYEYELNVEDYMKSDSVQFRKANKALIDKLNSDAAFRKKLLSAHPEMKQWLDNPNLSNSPTGYTWHHYEKAGIL